MPASPQGAKLMLLAVFFFAIAHASVKFLPQIPFYELVVWRQFIAILICLVMLKRAKISPWGKNRSMLIWRGVAGSLALTAYFYTLHNMPLASAVTLQYLSPILTLIIAHFALKERMDRGVWKFFALAFLGVALVKGFDARISIMDLCISLFAVVTSAIAYTSIRALRNSDHELVVVFYFPLVSLPLITPFAVNHWVWPVGSDWAFILAIGICTFLAQLFMTQSYQRDRAQDVAIYNYLGIFFALGIGFFFFHENFSALSFMGMALILLAVFLATLQKPKAMESLQKR